MVRIFKIVVVLMVLVVVLLAGGAGYLVVKKDEIMRRGLERELRYVYLSNAKVEVLRFHPIQGVMEVEGVTIFSPLAFKDEPAVSIGRAKVDFNVWSLVFGPTMIHRVELTDSALHIRYEMGRGTNIGTLMANAAQLEEMDRAASEAARGMPEPFGTRRPMIVKEFSTTSNSVHMSTNLLPFSSGTLEIGPVSLPEIGEGKPIMPARLATVFLRSLLSESVNVKGMLRPLGSRIKEELGSLL